MCLTTTSDSIAVLDSIAFTGSCVVHSKGNARSKESKLDTNWQGNYELPRKSQLY